MTDVWAEWARTWGIPDVAIADLIARITITGAGEVGGRSESAVMADIRLAAAKRGDMVLWRNNSGALPNPETGRWIRFGLGHESEEGNKRMKSSDLIGMRRLPITSAMVGTSVGQLVALEVKKPGWKHSNASERDRAQAAFGATVTAMGGCALRLTSDQPIKDLK